MHLYEDEKESLSAIDWLGHLHYQICNGGMAQACYNGYVDDVIDVYGSFNKWVEELKKEVDESTEEGKMAIKAATMIAQKVDDIPKVKNCMDCDGSGYTEYEEEDEDGETQTIEEPCDTCGGQGFYDVDDYKDVDLDDDNWDNRYYTEIESEPIDKLTNQSSTHSVVLDAIKGVKESMDIKEAKQILNENGYRLVEAVSYLGQAKQIAQRLGYFAFIDEDGKLVIHDDKRNIAEIDSIDYTDNYGKLRVALDNLGGATGHGVKYKISDDGICLYVKEF